MAFTEEQRAQVEKQLKAHQRKPENRRIALDSATSLELRINDGVFGSDIMSSAIHLARFLYTHQDLYRGKDCVDMGCGPGTQGIVMLKYGAQSVDFSDISPRAVTNTRQNLEHHKLNASVIESDLFENFPKTTYNVIVFNHPFFSGEPEDIKDHDNMLKRSMLGGTRLIERFFEQVPAYLRRDDIIIMPYFHFAGAENNPETHTKDKLKVREEHIIQSQEGLQQGNVSIYEIGLI